MKRLFPPAPKGKIWQGDFTINKLYGNTGGLKAEQLRRMEQFYRRRIPAEQVLTHELARQMTELSHETNRQLGLLATRRGEIAYVMVGTNKGVFIPDLSAYRTSSRRFRGLRLLHTHFDANGLTDDDLTDLALLRLDMVCAVAVGQDGLPGLAHLAHLIPENTENRFWDILPPARPSELHLDFVAFMKDLEGQFSRQDKSRKIDAIDRALLIRAETDPSRENSWHELRELAETSGVNVFDAMSQSRPQIDPRYVVGKGKLEEIVIRALQIDANLLIFDHELAPAQIRSIAEFTELRVIDRTQVILDIFARRARTRESKIQVELAQLKYRLPRLIHRDTSLSRLAGGIGGTGPGETKLEIDRRRVRERIHRLEGELKDIEKGRGQRRTRRDKAGLPVISIVGYTNAGKSTLLNALTQSRVFVENRLFATLDPKSARLRFPRDTEAVITDTVGFIRDLPKELFAAFRSTLEELHEADVLVHVIDVSNTDFETHIQAVETVLGEIGVLQKPIVRLFNKKDLFPDKDVLENLCRRFEATAVSALETQSLTHLLNRLEDYLGDAGISSPHTASPPPY
ncbi:MAG: GTPase HflX [Syntrophobacterales bacterium]|jgi:GTP-binding protein HflX|nr:GTPase HflX [Syntrophobacterales bacterium]